jgi:hypothetical protein
MAKSRAFQSVRDMVLSLGVVFAVVAVILLITLRDEPDDPVREVDTNLVRQAALLNAPYEVVVPSGLPDEWRPTSARVSRPGDDPFRWHIGFVTPSQEYAATGQSNRSLADYLDEERAGGRESGTTTIDGESWTRYERSDGERVTLARQEDGVITIVTGTGAESELVELAESLTAAPTDLPTALATAPVD